ncbi:MAG: PF20097 family protein [Candidatus Thorarchaeota archaeon]
MEFDKCPYCGNTLRRGGIEVRGRWISVQWVENPKKSWPWGPVFQRRKPLFGCGAFTYSTVRIGLLCEECSIVMFNPKQPKDIAAQLSDEADVWQFHFPNPRT